MTVNNAREMGILRSNAASPPINPPSTQELRVLAKARTIAAPIRSTNAKAAAFINIGSFLLYLS
jgi:hypothetical protein